MLRYDANERQALKIRGGLSKTTYSGKWGAELQMVFEPIMIIDVIIPSSYSSLLIAERINRDHSSMLCVPNGDENGT